MECIWGISGSSGLRWGSEMVKGQTVKGCVTEKPMWAAEVLSCWGSWGGECRTHLRVSYPPQRARRLEDLSTNFPLALVEGCLVF